MVEQDTVRLLRECDSGAKMGISSISDVEEYVKSERLKKLLEDCKAEHEKISGKIQEILNRFKDEGKDPNALVKGMSWIKTNLKLAMHESDHTIADLMTDGCNMGVKSLSKYLNQYKAADEESKAITERLINVEELLAVNIREFL